MKKRILIALMALSGLSMAQSPKNQEALITDRPDATESPYTVGKGNFQIETGAFRTTYDDNGTDVAETVFNTALLRYGLGERFELRLGWDYSQLEETRNNQSLFNATGLTPMLLGAKVELADEDGWIPQIGLLGHLRLPFTAISEFQPENTGMEFFFSFDHTLSEKSGIAYNLGARLIDDQPIEYVYTLAYGYSITDNWGAYAEVYGAVSENGATPFLWDAGITYLVNNNLQLDATIGTGINGEAQQDLLISAGFSYRILKNK